MRPPLSCRPPRRPLRLHRPSSFRRALIALPVRVRPRLAAASAEEAGRCAAGPVVEGEWELAGAAPAWPSARERRFRAHVTGPARGDCPRPGR
jgi:hypothetical protein